jgi:hypothetical protein
MTGRRAPSTQDKKKVNEETPPAQRSFGEIAATIGKYLIAIAAILGGIQAVISKWPTPKPDQSAALAPTDFCPQFIEGIPQENTFLYLLGKPEDQTVKSVDQLMLIRFFDGTGTLGFIKFSYIAKDDTFAVNDVTDDKCVGHGKSDFSVKNGDGTDVELKDEKKYHLLIKLDPGTKILHVDLSEP